MAFAIVNECDSLYSFLVTHIGTMPMIFFLLHVLNIIFILKQIL